MTTIAWDGNILAADSLVTIHHNGGYFPEKDDSRRRYRYDRTVKLAKPDGKATVYGESIQGIGCAGSASTLRLVLDAARKGMALDVVLTLKDLVRGDQKNVVLIVTTENVYEVEVDSSGTVWHTYDRADKVAIGSGGPAALLAMGRFGASAPSAVAIASTVCDYTDHQVRYFTPGEDETVQLYSYTPSNIDEIFEELLGTQ